MTDRDPVTIAREVLAAEELRDGTPANAPALREERWEFYEDLCTSQAPALARAVLNVAKLADDYEALARQCMTDGDVADAIDWENAASLIRAALEGETR